MLRLLAPVVLPLSKAVFYIGLPDVLYDWLWLFFHMMDNIGYIRLGTITNNRV
jgi:hypothetical protein